MSRLPLLWRILLATSIALTLLFAATGWIIQNTAARAMTATVNAEVRASFDAYNSLWRSRAESLAAVSRVMSRMSDVRAAFSTGDEATIRDTAGELWATISTEDAFFLVADPQGGVIASLGGDLSEGLRTDLPAVRQASAVFPRQAAGFMSTDGRLYQIVVTPVYVNAGQDLGLLNVLVAGYAVDEDVAASMKEAAGGSDFCFVAADAAEASTLPSGACSSLAAGEPSLTEFRQVESSGTPYTMLSMELLDVSGDVVGELRILRSLSVADEKAAALSRGILAIWALAILIGLAITYRLARRILEPVGELDRAAGEVAHGNFNYRVPLSHKPGSRDELGRLGEAFNQMCESIQKSHRELIRRERISTSAAIVHDLRNPLASIYGGAEMLRDKKLSGERIQRIAGNIASGAHRMRQLLQEFLETGQGGAGEMKPCRVEEMISAAVETNLPAADAQAVKISIDVPNDIEVIAKRSQLERVFLNLIANALEVMPKGGTIKVAAKAEDGSVVIRFQDSGPGIPAAVREKLFRPFATEGKDEGLGLGLAFCRQTVDDHCGKIWAEPDNGKGACFALRLPLASVLAAEARISASIDR